MLSNHIFGKKPRSDFRARESKNRAAVEMADHYNVDETSGKRALPEPQATCTRRKPATAKAGDSAARIRLGPK
jgi:hypothetical protein